MYDLVLLFRTQMDPYLRVGGLLRVLLVSFFFWFLMTSVSHPSGWIRVVPVRRSGNQLCKPITYWYSTWYLSLIPHIILLSRRQSRYLYIPVLCTSSSNDLIRVYFWYFDGKKRWKQKTEPEHHHFFDWTQDYYYYPDRSAVKSNFAQVKYHRDAIQ